MSANLAALNQAVRRAVTLAPSATAAWEAAVHAVEPNGYPVPPKLRAWDAAREVAGVSAQLADVLRGAPLSPDLTFLYFGLVDLWVPETETEEVGFHVAGGAADDPEAELEEPRLPYYPEDGFLESALLQEVRLASKALGTDYNVFDYGLMLGAAGTLAKFAARELKLPHAIMVGFDCGDAVRFL